LIASKRERKQYCKRGSKPNKLKKKAAICFLTNENINIDRESISDIANLRASSKSPSLSTCSSSSSSLEAAEKSSVDEDIKSIEQEETNLFLNMLLRIQEDYTESHQNNLKKIGLLKRLILLSHDANSLTSYYSSTDVALKQSVVDVIDSECQSIITWSRQIPDFERLSIETQTFLIEQNFLEIILIEFIWKTIQKSNCQAFVLNDYFVLDQSTCTKLGLGDTCEHLLRIAKHLQRLNLKYNEFVCLKFLALLKSQCLLLNGDEVMNLREKCFATLKIATQDHASNKSFRYDSLLMFFSDIKSLSLMLMSNVLVLGKTSAVELPTLLSDMYTSQQKVYQTNRT